jgi:predicted ribosome quality control (RQC) complex YloA/Tae2 family protein
MYVDAVTTAAVVDELEGKIAGGRVQDVIEVDDRTIGLEIYAHHERRYLLATIDPQAARCHLVSDKLRRGVEHSSPLGLLLRKYVSGARLMRVSQPAWERVLEFDFSGSEGEVRLIVETMDKRSNIILTVEGDILDCLKRVGPGQNRYRQLRPGIRYVPPPPQNRPLPDRVALSVIETMLRQEPRTEAARLLVKTIAGLSPLLAREVVYFASGDPGALAVDVAPGLLHAAFTQRLAEIVARHWQPCVAPAASSPGYVAFAAYPLTHIQGWEAAGSISEAMVLYFGAPVGAEAYTPAKGHVQEQIAGAQARLTRKLEALDRQATSQTEIEILRKKGELILAYGATFSPKQAVLHAQYDPDEPEITIELDPDQSPAENARTYFERYEKAKRALQDVPGLRAETEHEVAYLRQLASDLELAESWPEIDLVREALQEAGYWQGPHRRSPRGGAPGIRRITTPDGFVILIGRNAGQNHRLITEQSAGDDLWLHARDVPGSHVILKNDGRPIPEEAIRRAAELAAYYSSRREEPTVEVAVTERRHVRPVKGGRPGMVTFRNERTLVVRPARQAG